MFNRGYVALLPSAPLGGPAPRVDRPYGRHRAVLSEMPRRPYTKKFKSGGSSFVIGYKRTRWGQLREAAKDLGVRGTWKMSEKQLRMAIARKLSLYK